MMIDKRISSIFRLKLLLAVICLIGLFVSIAYLFAFKFQTPIDKLKAYVIIDPLKSEYGREVKNVPEYIEITVNGLKEDDSQEYFPYLAEYALNLHLIFLEQTWLARELPVDDNILLAEFVRLAGIPKYKTANEAGWRDEQFYGKFNRSGYSSYQIYKWYLESKDKVDLYPNAKRMHEIGDKILKTGMHGVGGHDDVCHYGCE
ncbi:MAG: hypothetical protein KAS23_14305 [Anaerohalosphaera sp.]|nr:hypothetical protein [Anaerohalosphaera sp.]